MRHPPAWYPDPTGLHDHRWWDGVEWTAHVADGGVAGVDPLPPAPADPVGGPSPAATADTTWSAAGPTARRSSAPGVAVTALVLGIAALLLGWIPFLGLVLGLGALVVAIVALRRTRGGRPGRGLATGGVLTAALGLTAGLATTVLALMILTPGGGGGFGDVGRAYLDCLEVQQPEVCERRLADDVAGLLGG